MTSPQTFALIKRLGYSGSFSDKLEACRAAQEVADISGEPIYVSRSDHPLRGTEWDIRPDYSEHFMTIGYVTTIHPVVWE